MRMTRDRLALEVRRARRPFVVYLGLVICGTTALLGILRNQTFLRPWEDHVRVRAFVADAKGIVSGKQEVRVAGVKVGVVTEERLVGGRAQITMQIDERYAPVYRDATVRLRPVTPLQDMYVELRRGHPAAGRLDGDVIPESQTTSPVDISRVLDTFDADTRDRLATLLHQLGPGLADNGVQLRAAFERAAPFLRAAEQVTGALAERRAELRRLIGNTRRLTTALAGHDAQLARLVVRGEATLGELAREDAPLARTIRALPGMVERLDAAMTSLGVARGRLDPAIDALRPAVARLAPGLDAAGRLGREARPAFSALASPVAALTPMAHALRPTAGALAQALDRLRSQAGSFDRLTRLLVPCREIMRQFFSNTPSVGKFANAYGAYPRGDTTIDVGTFGGRSGHGLRQSKSCTPNGPGPLGR